MTIMKNIITRKNARALGLTSYYTGEPCKNGHTSYRYVQSGTCAQCVRDSNLNPSTPGRVAKLEELKVRIEASTKRIEAKAHLVRAKFRLFDNDRPAFSMLAYSLTATRFPDLLECDVDPKHVGTDRKHGASMCGYDVYHDDVELLRKVANDMFQQQTRKFLTSSIVAVKLEIQSEYSAFVDTTPPINFN